jgi:hypothetical protein
MRSLLSIFLCLFAISSSCAQTSTKHAAIKQTRPPDSRPQYFPVGLFSKYPELSEWRARWYASELRGLEEPSLLEGKANRGSVAFRFLLIPSFTPSLVIRLVVNPNGSGTLVARLGTKRRATTETAPQQKTVSVSPEQVNKFLGLLYGAHFWTLQTAQSESVTGADGEEWLLEVRQNDEYHVVDRWHGWIEASFARACDYLQELSPLKVDLQRRKRPTSQQPGTGPD